MSCGRATSPADPSVVTGTGDYQFGAAPDTLPLIVCKRDGQQASGSATIGAAGGQIQFGPHKLTVPPGALSADTLISASVLPGDTLAVDLEPQGLQFAVPVELALNYNNCSVSPDLAVGVLYTDTTLAKVLGVVPSHDYYKEWTVIGSITHFSVYAAAETRKAR